MYQLLRITSYGLYSRGKKTTARRVVGEIQRKKSYCRHVHSPITPIPHYFDLKALDEVPKYLRKALALEHAKTGKKPQKDSQVLAVCIFSNPNTVEKIYESEEEYEKYKLWYKLTLNFCHNEFGEDFFDVFPHFDESHPHIHAVILPRIINNRVVLTAHPGRNANIALASESYRTRKEAYIFAMEAMQERYYQQVGKLMGWRKKSDNPRKHVPYAQYMKLKEQGLVNTLNINDVTSPIKHVTSPYTFKPR